MTPPLCVTCRTRARRPEPDWNTDPHTSFAEHLSKTVLYCRECLNTMPISFPTPGDVSEP